MASYCVSVTSSRLVFIKEDAIWTLWTSDGQPGVEPGRVGRARSRLRGDRHYSPPSPFRRPFTGRVISRIRRLERTKALGTIARLTRIPSGQQPPWPHPIFSRAQPPFLPAIVSISFTANRHPHFLCVRRLCGQDFIWWRRGSRNIQAC